MRFDLYAELASQRACPTDGRLPTGLTSGFIDGCTSWSARGSQERNEARDRYRSCRLKAVRTQATKTFAGTSTRAHPFRGMKCSAGCDPASLR